MNLTQNPDSCPAANICALSDPTALACGETDQHIPPLVVAEFLCPRALAGSVAAQRAKLVRVESEHPLWGHTQRAKLTGLLLDQALQPGEADPKLRLIESTKYADQVLKAPYARFPNTFGVALLGIYRPAFLARIDGVALTHAELEPIRQGLGMLYDALQAAPVHTTKSQHIIDARDADQPHTQCLREKGERMGMEAKLIGFMLAARQGTHLYPASLRELQASGTLVPQNHDAYQIDRGRKSPYRLGTKSRSDTQARLGMGRKYDASIKFINMNAVLGEAIKTLAQTPQYRLLPHQPPQLPDVGRWLRAELDGRQLNEQSVRILDIMGTRLQEEMGGFTIAPAANGDWDVLPPNIIGSSVYGNATPEEIQAANASTELYLRHGNNAPSPAQLRELISDMRKSRNPYARMVCVGAYIDLARHSESQPSDSLRILAAAEELARDITTRDQKSVSTQELGHTFTCGLQLAYMPKYKKALSGRRLSIDDEAELYRKLLELGEQTLAPCATVTDAWKVRGIQFEIGIHLLNARCNLLRKTVLHSMWPSVPREDDPHDFNFAYRTGWDAAITSAAFLDQGRDCRYLQLKATDSDTIYDPTITVVIGKDDLGTRTTADIIEMCIQEMRTTPDQRANAQQKLRAYEAAFFQKLGLG